MSFRPTDYVSALFTLTILITPTITLTIFCRVLDKIRLLMLYILFKKGQLY